MNNVVIRPWVRSMTTCEYTGKQVFFKEERGKWEKKKFVE